METFKKREIEAVFKLTSGVFGNGADEISIKGLRIIANIQCFPKNLTQANMQIFGLSQDVIKRLLTLKIRRQGNIVDSNTVTLKYTDNTVHTLFHGGIWSAIVDYNTMPQVPMIIESLSTLGAQMCVPGGLCFEGVVPVESIMRKLAGLAGYTLINYGVTTTLENETLNGSVQDMIDRVARDANIISYVSNNQLIISPHGVVQNQLPELVVSAETGLVGAPIPGDTYITFTHLFLPEFSPLRMIRMIFPEMPFIEGNFLIQELSHSLDSEQPGGRWFSQIKAVWLDKANG